MKPHVLTQPLGQRGSPCYTSSATMRFLRSGLSSTEPGALCAFRRLSLRVSASTAARRALVACSVTRIQNMQPHLHPEKHNLPLVPQSVACCRLTRRACASLHTQHRAAPCLPAVPPQQQSHLSRMQSRGMYNTCRSWIGYTQYHLLHGVSSATHLRKVSMQARYFFPILIISAQVRALQSPT